jgi:hypothetical protein
MKQRTINQLAEIARVSPADCPKWALRRRRLSRLSRLLETDGTPVRLFTTLECYRGSERLGLRQPGSPLALAYGDPIFRREGLKGDSIGDGIAFFGLSMREAHALLCDCGYGGPARVGATISALVAERARALAAKRSFAEIRDRLAEWF